MSNSTIISIFEYDKNDIIIDWKDDIKLYINNTNHTYFKWASGLLEPSLSYATKTYVDGSLALRDTVSPGIGIVLLNLPRT